MTLVSYDYFLSQIMHKDLAVVSGFFRFDMHADSILVGGEIEDAELDSSFIVTPSDKIYKIEEDGCKLFEVRDINDVTLLNIFVK